MKVGPNFTRRLVLDDGTHVVLRCIRPSDAEALREAFHALSAESRYARFLAYIADLTPPMLRYLTEVDGVDHVAIAAFLDHGNPGKDAVEGRLVGVGRFIRLSAHATEAEVAITVGDPLQGLGLGAALRDALVLAATERGVHAFVAHALPSNRAIRGLFAQLGPLAPYGLGDAEAFQLRLSAPPSPPSTPSRLARHAA